MEMENPEVKKAVPPKLLNTELTNFLIRFIFVACLGSTYCGFNLWLVNNPITIMEYFNNISTNLAEASRQDPAMPPALLVFTVISFLTGCLIGSLVFAPLADNYGRRKAMMYSDIISLVSSALLTLSKSFRSTGTYAFARILTGVTTGIFYCAVPLYLGEVSTTNLRGSLSVMHVTFVSVGIMLCQGLGTPDLLGNEKGWPYLWSIPGIIVLFQLIFMYFYPDSPRYLLIQLADEEGARKALKLFRKTDDVEEEIKQYREEDAYEQKEKKMTILKLLVTPRQRWQLLCVVALFATQQFSGVYAAYYYSEEILNVLQVTDSLGQYIIAASSFLLLFGQAFSVYKMDSLGRRPLLLLGVGTCIITCVMLTLSLQIQVAVPWMVYASCMFLLFFTTGNLIGPNSIPHLMITELFLQSSRASAFSIGGFVQWFFIFFISFTFVLLERHISSYTFLIYLPFCVAGFVYTIKFAPETKKKTFLEIRKILETFLAKKYVTDPSVAKKHKKRVRRK